MSDHKIKNAIAAVMALSLTCAGGSAIAETQTMNMGGNIKGMEKCFGIAKTGMNDCGNASHNCAGEAKLDGSKTDWMLVPTGLCKKIVGGSTT